MAAKNIQKLSDKLGIEASDHFKPILFLEKEWLHKHSNENLSFSKQAEKVKENYAVMKELAGNVDPTLIRHLDALATQALNRIAKAEKKLIRAEKRKHSDALGQLEKVKSAIFPGGTLQERKDNFLNFYQTNPKFISDLLSVFDPFGFEMHVIKE